jgi:hypothetical protein
MKTIRRVMMIALVLALSLQASAVSAAGSASMTLTLLTPAPVLIGSDLAIDLVLSVTNVTPGVTLTEIFLTYDSTLVTPLGIEAQPDFFGPPPIFVPNSLPANSPAGPCGVHPCLYLMVGGLAQTNNTGAVARFRFRVIGAGSANFEVINPNADSVVLDSDGSRVDISGSPISRNVATVFRATAGGTVSRQGLPPSLACTVVSAAGISSFTESSGNFTLNNLPSGTNPIRAEYPGYLASQKSITVNSGPVTGITVGTTSLLGGDVNNDAVINIADIMIIINNFGKFAGVRAYPDCVSPDLTADRIDINDDKMINISDVAIAAGNFTKTGPTIWP